MTHPIVYVYSDDGVSSKSLKALVRMLKEHLKEAYPIKLIDSKTLSEADWEKHTLLLAVPGGRDVPYHEKLAGNACHKIKTFVEKGGKYLGICAGAYFGCASFTFEKDSPIEVMAKRELQFFPGHAIGPALGNGKFCYLTEKGADAADILWNKEKMPFHVYYNGGCAFPDAKDHEGIEVIANYSSLENTPAAIVICSVGKGLAILCGVHVEMKHAFLPKNDPYIKSFSSKLSASEKKRWQLCQYLMDRLIDV